jgi:quercetin dioxygenase-like cupin family protein
MPGHAKINLQDIEDTVAGRLPGLEGRMGRADLGSRDLGISRFTYAPNVRQESGHSHREQEEAYVVAAGSGRVLLNGQVETLRQWDVLRVSPEVVRAFEAGPDGLDIIAVGGPKPEGGDGVRAEVQWPD